MRRITGVLSAVVVGALFSSCGGPPPVLNGRITYSWGCEFEMGATPDTTHPSCPGGSQLYAGANGEGSPPLNTGCTVTTLTDGTQRIRWRIARGGSTLDTSEGLSVCGQVAAVGQEMTNGTVDLYLRGSSALRNNLGTTCRVRINTLTAQENRAGFTGQIQCTDAHDNLVPYRKVFIRGLGGATGVATAEPDWGDFAFDNCSTAAQPACQ